MNATRLARSLALALLAGTAVPALAQYGGPCAPDQEMLVTGRVLEPPVLPGGPVPCCEVEITVQTFDIPPVSATVRTRTNGDGTFAACVPCVGIPTEEHLVTAVALCCGGMATPVTIPSCIDVATNEFITLDLGDITCVDPPVTGMTHLRGFVGCRPGALVDPVAGCGILIDTFNLEDDFARTDASGNWEACIPCDDVTREATITAQCCGEQTVVSLVGCPASVTVPSMICDPCPVPPCPGPEEIEVTGLVTCSPAPGIVQPMADCLVELQPIGPDTNGDGLPNDCVDPGAARVRTDSDGRYSWCFPCPIDEDCASVTWTIRSRALCCFVENIRTITGCAGSIALDDLACPGTACPPSPCPTGEAVVEGRVTCVTPAGTQPMAGCDVIVTPTGCMASPVTAMTDADGRYTTCVPCDCTGVEVTTSCCPASAAGSVDCATPNVVDLDCGPCAGGGCGFPPGQEVFGTVRCTDAGGLPQPVAGCTVRAECPGVGPVTDVTDASGNYSICLPCGACTDIVVTAECCGVQTLALADPTRCVPVRADLDCGPCAPVGPCPAPGERQVFGRVTCTDPASGDPQPMAGCPVIIDCPGQPPLTVVTDVDGDYATCMPCGTCTLLTVTASCCGTAVDVVPAAGCAPTEANVSCGDCIPPRPCATPDGVLVSGTLRCDHGGVSLAGCPVQLTPIDSGGAAGSAVTAVVDGAGNYAACVPCPPGGLSQVDALATCCASATSSPIAGCPETATLPDMTCSECSPCPAGMTRVQGRVRCRGGGPVAACDVLIILEGCGPAQTFVTTTDREGKYVACVPCPCPRGRIRVTSLCCPATRTVETGECGPVTPMPTLFCPVPCR